MNLLQMVLGGMNNESSVNSLSKKSGGSGKQISKLLVLAVPLLIKYLTKNASTKEGASSLAGALGQHTSNKTVASQIADADEVDGDKILKHILGGDMGSVLSSLSQETGMDEKQVSSALDSMTPALMSEISAATTKVKKQKEEKPGFDLSDGLDLGDIMSMFGGSASGASSQGPDLGGLLSQFMGGSKKTDSSTDGTALLKSLMSFMS